MGEIIAAFKALRGAPRAFWLMVVAFSFDLMAYYGILPLMKPYLAHDVGIRPELASLWVSIFTGSLTIFMIVLGKPAESRLGIRRGLVLALGLSALGRAVYATAPFLGGAATILVSMMIVGLGEGMVQPLCYAGVKKYTDEKNGSMGFALLYAGLNFGSLLIGPISAKVRTSFDAMHGAVSGFDAVNWVCAGVTALTMLVFALFMTRDAESRVVRASESAHAEAAKAGTVKDEGRPPYLDARFLFFIFALLPVRTLFAHQWLTMPEYVLRAYPKEIQDRMEWFVDSLNPLVVLFGVPIFTALTKRYHVLTMMFVGSAVSAASSFLLAGGPSTTLLIAYVVVFSIGEALWASRFLEYAAELAPPGRVAQYMGLANVPWLLAKMTTGFYSGYLLERYCPASGPKDTGKLWLIYGAIASISPIALLVARKWLLAGMASPTPKPAPSR